MILLALALYAPHIAKYLAYAECAVTTTDKSCGCIISNSTNKAETTVPAQQKEFSFKLDWQTFSSDNYQSGNNGLLINKLQLPVTKENLNSGFYNLVFRPPSC